MSRLMSSIEARGKWIDVRFVSGVRERKNADKERGSQIRERSRWRRAWHLESAARELILSFDQCMKST